MANDTETTRQMALTVLEKNGFKWERVGKGQRYVVRLEKNGEESFALLKVASLGSAMVRTSDDDTDSATISGFGPDIDYVLFAVGDATSQTARTIRAFLVPASEAEGAFREAHRDFRANSPNSQPSSTWVISFFGKGYPAGNDFARKWANYEIGSAMSVSSPTVEQTSQKLTVAEAKRLLAESFGVSPENIKIVIEA